MVITRLMIPSLEGRAAADAHAPVLGLRARRHASTCERGLLDLRGVAERRQDGGRVDHGASGGAGAAPMGEEGARGRLGQAQLAAGRSPLTPPLLPSGSSRATLADAMAPHGHCPGGGADTRTLTHKEDVGGQALPPGPKPALPPRLRCGGGGRPLSPWRPGPSWLEPRRRHRRRRRRRRRQQRRPRRGGGPASPPRPPSY